MPPSLSVLVFKLYCVVYILSANSFSVFFFALDILSSKTSIIRRYTEGKLRRGQVQLNCLSYDVY